MIWKLRQIYHLIVSSVAFLPAIISVFFLILSLLMLDVQASAIGAFIKRYAGLLLVKNTSNAREILSALTSGIIALTVFSYSTVMVVIKQASSQFTPRILPRFLEDRNNQFILGFYVGTIVYSLIQLLHVESQSISLSTQLGVLLALFFGIASMGLFIYFIHLIFLKIQVDYLIPKASGQAIRSIEQKEHAISVPISAQQISAGYSLKVKGHGYLNKIDERRLAKFCRKHGLEVVLLHPVGTFLQANQVICQVNRNLAKEKTLENRLLSCFVISFEPFGEKTYLYGINQMAEIAIKALSPSVNDPGTAMICLDYLSNTFCCLLQKRQFGIGNQGLQREHYIEKELSLEKMLFSFIAPIGTYGKQDARVHLKLLDFYDRLLVYASKEERAIIEKFLMAERQSISENIQSPPDLEILEESAKAIESTAKSVSLEK